MKSLIVTMLLFASTAIAQPKPDRNVGLVVNINNVELSSGWTIKFKNWEPHLTNMVTTKMCESTYICPNLPNRDNGFLLVHLNHYVVKDTLQSYTLELASYIEAYDNKGDWLGIVSSGSFGKKYTLPSNLTDESFIRNIVWTHVEYVMNATIVDAMRHPGFNRLPWVGKIVGVSEDGLSLIATPISGINLGDEFNIYSVRGGTQVVGRVRVYNLHEKHFEARLISGIAVPGFELKIY